MATIKARITNTTTGEIWERDFKSMRSLNACIGWMISKISKQGEKVVFEIIGQEIDGVWYQA